MLRKSVLAAFTRLFALIANRDASMKTSFLTTFSFSWLLSKSLVPRLRSFQAVLNPANSISSFFCPAIMSGTLCEYES